MNEQTNQVVTPTQSKFNFHKVFAAIGIILTVVIIIVAAIWYLTDQNTKGTSEDDTVKVTTSSAKPATKSATSAVD